VLVVSGESTSGPWKGLDNVSIIRKGAKKSYSDGWEVAFGKKNAGKKNAAATAVKAKKGAKKKAGKKKK